MYKLTGNTSSKNLLTVGVPNLGNAPPSDANGPTGQVSTGAPGVTTLATDFPVNNGSGNGKALFIFDNLDGSISAWRGGFSQAVVVQSIAGASFTGLAIGNIASGAAQIYAADQNSGNVFAFNSQFNKVGTLTDPNGLPSGFNAFNVQNLNGTLFITYANPNNPLGGVVDEYTRDGTFIKRLIDDVPAHLDTPWGLAIAPKGWGQFGGDLLVGNNDGDGTINAYTLGGLWQGKLTLKGSQIFSQGELWALTFGNGGGAGSPEVLYFDAGLPGATNGLIGAISSVPEPSSAVLGLIALGVLTGGWRWKNRRRRREVLIDRTHGRLPIAVDPRFRVLPRSLPQSARGSGRCGGVTQSQSKQPSMVTCSALWGDLSTDVWSLPPGDASCYFYSAKPIGVENANDAGEVACNKPEVQAKGIERHMFLNSIRLRFRLASPVPAHSDGKSGVPIHAP